MCSVCPRATNRRSNTRTMSKHKARVCPVSVPNGLGTLRRQATKGPTMIKCDNCEAVGCIVARVPKRRKPLEKRLCVECFNLYQHLYRAVVVRFDKSAWENT